MPAVLPKQAVSGTILGPDARPMPRASVEKDLTTAYRAADRFGQELANWNPWLSSADREILRDRNTITARNRDIVRNNGYAAGAVSSHLNKMIGSGLRLQATPDWRSLGQTPEWAAEWAREAEGEFRLYAEDPDHYCDATLHGDLGEMMGLGCRHKMVDGDALALLLWEPNRGGRYATTVQMVDPDRLSNPQSMFDTARLRGGVELDDLGAATAVHIRKSHPADVFGVASGEMEWERIEVRLPWGRRQVIHDFNRQRADQHRGVGLLTPVISKFKMLDSYEVVELQAAVVNAVFAAFLESPLDPELMAAAVGASEALGNYQDMRSSFHDDRTIKLDGVRIPTLFPGEKVQFTDAARPNTAFGSFTESALRHLAAGTGHSYEELSRNYSDANYSSVRAALLDSWVWLTVNRAHFIRGFVQPIYAAWLEEAIDRGLVETPPGAPAFWDAKAAWCRARWSGPGRGWVDPVKEAQGAQMRMDAMVSTLQRECAEQGLDWEEVLDQRERELAELRRRGLPLPEWAISETTVTDDGTSQTGFVRTGQPDGSEARAP